MGSAAAQKHETLAEPAAEAPANAPLSGMILIESIEELARTWHSRSWKGGSAGAPAGAMTPEELTLSAAEHGVTVRFEERSLASLAARDFPCVALTKDGRGLILAQRSPSYFNLWRKGLDEQVPAAALAERYAGVVFFVAPAEDGQASRSVAKPEPEASPSPTRLVLQALWGQHGAALVLLGVAALVSNLFLVALPIFSMAVYDRVVPHLAYETLWALSIGVGLVLFGDLAIRVVRLKLSDAVSFSIAVELQARLYGRLLGARFGRAPVAPGTLANALRDIDGLCQTWPALIVALAVDLPWFLATCVLIYAVAGAVAWTPAIGLACLLLVHLWSHATRGRTLVAARLSAAQTNQANEALGIIETVKAWRGERSLLRRWERITDETSFASHLSRLSQGVSVQATVVISQAMIVVALIIGVYEMGNHAITIGGLSAATLLIGRMMGPASQILSLVHRASELGHSARQVAAILDAPQEGAGDGTRAPKPIRGALALSEVGFTYPGETAPALKGISLAIRPGERVGIVGRIGCGKSTLMRLLVRLCDASEGTVSLDEHDIRQYAERDVRASFGFMRQDAVLIDDTLQANLAFGVDRATPEAVERAVAISGVKDFAARHPSGYGLRVGPRGERLSGGERQAVALARTLIGDPPVLLLDEPTAAMDNALEMKVVRDLAGALDGRTLIVATHRAPLLALVDRLVWLEGGRLVADGPKAEILGRIQSAAAST
jgi:ATP-binding cassette subfamily C protein LapB